MPDLSQLPPADRFWSHVHIGNPTDCWPWTARLDRYGYGRIDVGPRGRKAYWIAHRAAYGLHHGSLPADSVLDHTCRNRACCNPAHLEPVTNEENLRRGGDARFPPHLIPIAAEMYARGQSLTSIARQLGYSRQAVSYRLRARAGVRLRPPGRPKKRSPVE